MNEGIASEAERGSITTEGGRLTMGFITTEESKEENGLFGEQTELRLSDSQESGLPRKSARFQREESMKTESDGGSSENQTKNQTPTPTPIASEESSWISPIAIEQPHRIIPNTTPINRGMEANRKYREQTFLLQITSVEPQLPAFKSKDVLNLIIPENKRLISSSPRPLIHAPLLTEEVTDSPAELLIKRTRMDTSLLEEHLLKEQFWAYESIPSHEGANYSFNLEEISRDPDLPKYPHEI